MKMVLAVIFLIFIILCACAGHDVNGKGGNVSRTAAREETVTVKSMEVVKIR